jgi:hypothetical protein
MLVSLNLNPLRLQFHTNDGGVYQQPLSAAQAQSLALALAANSTPELGRALAELLNARPELLLPEIAAAINAEAEKYQARDKTMLAQLGVSDACN